MKHFLLLGLFSLFCCVAIQAQEPEMVVIDGVTFSADLKTLIKYPADKKGEKYVVPEGTEIISESAFEWARLNELILPSSLNEIGNYAFNGCYYIDSIGWNKFPDKIGIKAFNETLVRSFYVLNDSCNCVLYNRVLYSRDKKRLLLVPTFGKYESVAEGTEVIGRGAYESNAMIYRITLPSTLKRIEDLAFFRSTETYITSLSYLEHLYSVECKALTPPVIIGNPFPQVQETDLIVPEESFELYYNASIWKDFQRINGQWGSVVEKIACDPTVVCLSDQTISIQSEKEISCVSLYDQNGRLVVSKVISTNSYSFNIDRITSGLLLLEITYRDATRETFKLCKI